MSNMKRMTVREAQHGFGAALDRVLAGESIEITRHRKPVARLVPLATRPGTSAWPDILQRLREDFGGRVTPDSQPLLDELRGER